MDGLRHITINAPLLPIRQNDFFRLGSCYLIYQHPIVRSGIPTVHAMLQAWEERFPSDRSILGRSLGIKTAPFGCRFSHVGPGCRTCPLESQRTSNTVQNW